MKYFFVSALLLFGVMGCKDEDFENGKIQSVDNKGNNQNIISTAVTATSNSEFLANAVDASTDESEINLIPVVLNSNIAASQDIHVKFVTALDSLESYNTRKETNYIMPGDVGTPAFTLVDDGLVTIPKGSYVGYLKIKTVTNDYFGDTQYAFAYKIESVQEPGYTISGNHNFGIVAVIPKNAYDGLYRAKGKLEGHPSASGPIDFAGFKMVTSGQFTIVFNAVYGKTGIFGVEVEATVDPATNLVSLKETDNSSAALAFSDPTNHYDPATKTFFLKFGWGTRVETLTLTYTGAR